MNLWKLRLSMAGTLALIIGLSTLVFTIVLSYAGIFDILTLAVLVVVFNIVQWLIAPYLIGALYKVRALPENENPQLHQTVTNLCQKSGISKPKLMLSQIALPNAFAYGSPFSGSRVAVTQGLLTSLNDGEVEAVLGHELGHIKHKDVQIMMAVSFLPALFTYIAYSFMFSGSGNNRNQGGNGVLIGIGFMAFSWVLNLGILHISRIREYYADRHSVSVVDNGAEKLSTGLAKIVHTTKRNAKPQQKQQTATPFKALFIADPDRAATDSAMLNNQQLVQEILQRKLTLTDKLIEALSTHPNIVKRLRALDELGQNRNA
jgi:heat shock protein HtpX